jgi:hypothetical protein
VAGIQAQYDLREGQLKRAWLWSQVKTRTIRVVVGGGIMITGSRSRPKIDIVLIRSHASSTHLKRIGESGGKFHDALVSPRSALQALAVMQHVVERREGVWLPRYRVEGLPERFEGV